MDLITAFNQQPTSVTKQRVLANNSATNLIRYNDEYNFISQNYNYMSFTICILMILLVSITWVKLKYS